MYVVSMLSSWHLLMRIEYIGTTLSAPILRLAPLRPLCTLSPRAALQHPLPHSQTPTPQRLRRDRAHALTPARPAQPARAALGHGEHV
jgi:hypothetical protein